MLKYMPTLIIPIGFSGSGKTTYYKQHYKPDNSIYISKDQLRIKFCHDINDQSQNKKVAIVASQMLTKAIEQNIDSDVTIYYDNINLGILPTVKKYLELYPRLKIKIIFFMDTLDPQLRIKRIQRDLKNKIIRSNTVDIIAENYENEIRLFNKNLNSIINYYREIDPNDDIILTNRLTVAKFQNNKSFTLHHLN